jgi:hypothetical protein
MASVCCILTSIDVTAQVHHHKSIGMMEVEDLTQTLEASTHAAAMLLLRLNNSSFLKPGMKWCLPQEIIIHCKYYEKAYTTSPPALFPHSSIIH